MELLPPNITTVVTITQINGDGTSDGTTLSNVSVIVQGENVPVGQRAYVQNNRIIGNAPNLTITTVAI